MKNMTKEKHKLCLQTKKARPYNFHGELIECLHEKDCHGKVSFGGKVFCRERIILEEEQRKV
jgi:hypothetical protein